MTPVVTVLIVFELKNKAPEVSQIAPIMHAVLKLMIPEPTAVPKEFAQSLAPTAKAKANATTNPRISSHKFADCQSARYRAFIAFWSMLNIIFFSVLGKN